tara:strand:- start:25946 stop:26686 length:741 start_codon:yes stop_codon:yes gene_type:complete
MNILALIPARMGSSRFPGKPLANINGKPMIGHVLDNIRENKLLSSVAVATCDEIISDYVESIGGKAVMTSDSHDRASDRCAEALLKIERENNEKFDVVVMVQGDEPMINSQMITEALEPFQNNNQVLVSNLLGKIDTKEEFEDRNCIKVVCDLKGNALYFSREPIPSRSRFSEVDMGKQICVIPFKRDFLIEYNSLPETPLEKFESIDMNRVLEHGLEVVMVKTGYTSYSVDTKSDLEKVAKLLKN